MKESPIVASHSAEAVNAVAVAQEAVEKARNVQIQEAVSASQRESTAALAEALREVFGEKEERQQFINVSRVPMICKNIEEIHAAIERIEKALVSLGLVRKLVFGFVGLALTALAGGAFVYLIPAVQVATHAATIVK